VAGDVEDVEDVEEAGTVVLGGAEAWLDAPPHAPPSATMAITAQAAIRRLMVLRSRPQAQTGSQPTPTSVRAPTA
jgi:hypothetical protein